MKHNEWLVLQSILLLFSSVLVSNILAIWDSTLIAPRLSFDMIFSLVPGAISDGSHTLIVVISFRWCCKCFVNHSFDFSSFLSSFKQNIMLSNSWFIVSVISLDTVKNLELNFSLKSIFALGLVLAL